MKKWWHNPAVFLMIILALALLYRGFENNYFFSDDFQWLSHAVLVDDSASELFLVRGRDFNPLVTFIFWLLLKIGGPSPLVFRVFCFLAFAGSLFLLYHILSRYFELKTPVALWAVLMCGFNVHISEVMLYLSTIVYALTALLFLLALKFYLDGRKVWFILFLLAAFQVKETIILAAIPLFLYEKVMKKRLFIAGSAFGIFLTRFIFQAGDTGSYTHYATTENIFYKIYFLLLHPMNLSAMGFSLPAGIFILTVLALIFIYYLRKDRRALFFGSFFILFVLFFSLLHRLSSKYYFYPAFAFWGLAALLAGFFYKKSRLTPYVLAALLVLSLVINYPALRTEVGDYRILGDFSKTTLLDHAKSIKDSVDLDGPDPQLRIPKQGNTALASTYRKVYNRPGILKLLPFRKKSIGGFITPFNLVPLVFYPEKVVRWLPMEETGTYFQGRLLVAQVD